MAAAVSRRTTPEILRYGNPGLRSVCRAVDPEDPRTGDLADALKRTLRNDGGVGLAAPQIGTGSRVCVVTDRRDNGGRSVVLVNPVLESCSEELCDFEEGCLSFPGLYRDVRRPREIAVRYFDLQGRECLLESDGLLARVVQHEVDHLDGILFIDHLPAWRRWMLGPRLWWLAFRARGSLA